MARCTKLEEANSKLLKENKQKDYAVSTLQEQVNAAKMKSSSRSPGSHSNSPGFLKSSFDGSSRSLQHSQVSVEKDISSSDTSALMEEIEQLKNEVNSLKSAAGERSRVRSPLSASTGFGGPSGVLDVSRFKMLNEEVSTWKDRCESLMSELQTAKRKVASMESEVVKTRELLGQAQDAKLKAESQYRAARDEIVQLRDVSEQHSTALKSELKMSQGVAARHASDADTVSTHADSLQKRVQALLIEKEAMEKVKDDALSLANQAKAAARAAIAEKESVAKELDEKVVFIASLKARYDSLEASKRASDAQFEALHAKLESAYSAAQMNEANAAAIAGQALHAEDASAQLLQRLQAMQERCDAAELSMEASRAQIENLEETVKVKCEQYDQVVSDLEEATNKVEALTKNGAVTADQNNAVVLANSLLEQKVANLTQDLSDRDETIRRLTEQVDSLTNSVSQLMEDTQEKDLLLKNAGNALESVKSKSEMNTTGLETQANDLIGQLEIEKERADKAEENAREARALHLNAMEATKKLKATLAFKDEEFENMREMLKAESERSDALSELMSNRDEDIKLLRQEVADLKAKVSQADDLLLEGGDGMEKVDAMHANLVRAQEEIASLKDDVEEKAKELQQSLSIRKDKDRKIESLEAAITDLNSQVQYVGKSLEETEDKLRNYEERALQAEMNASDAKSLARDYELAKLDAEKEIESLSQSLDSAKKELRELQEERSGVPHHDVSFGNTTSFEDDIASLKERISILEKHLSEEKKKTESLENDLRTEKRRANAAAMKAAGLAASDPSPQTTEDVGQANTAPSPVTTAVPGVTRENEAHETNAVVKDLVSSIFVKF